MVIQWDQTGERFFETGVDRGVLYPASDGTYPKGVAWNGLTAVNESPSGGEPSAIWADNMKYGSLTSTEEFGGSIEAYTYPEEFAECDGSIAVATGVYIGQQKRKLFGFSYRTKIGNDIEGDELGYKLHLVYGALASPSDRSHSTVNDNPDAETMSWDFSTTPVTISATDADGKKYKPTSHIVIDSTKVSAAKLTAIETILYGSADAEPKLPLPDEVITTLSAAG